MKKQYIKPQIKEISVRPMSLILASPDRVHTEKIGTDELMSREGNAFEDDEEEDNMWNSRLW